MPPQLAQWPAQSSSVKVCSLQGAAPGSRRVLHVIGYSHVDAAWLWPWRDSSNLVLTTARSALDRINETPGFRYCHSSAIHYRWIQKADPAMFQEILRRIREGRWEVVGGWPVEPDCNIPATESFVRHALYGKAYCKEALGVDVKIGFNPDSFGHAAGLPTILKQSGYGYYVFMRPGDQEQDPDKKLPLLFWWQGPDGSRVLTLRILGSYDSAASKIPTVAGNSFAPGFSDGALFLGVGDHGGAVTKAQIQQVLEMRNDTSLPELRWSTTGEFFKAVESSPAMAKLPVISGDLQHHSRGCYSACGEEKYQNRRSERAMVQVGEPFMVDLCHARAEISPGGVHRCVVEHSFQSVSRFACGHCPVLGLSGCARWAGHCLSDGNSHQDRGFGIDCQASEYGAGGRRPGICVQSAALAT